MSQKPSAREVQAQASAQGAHVLSPEEEAEGRRTRLLVYKTTAVVLAAVAAAHFGLVGPNFALTIIVVMYAVLRVFK